MPSRTDTALVSLREAAWKRPQHHADGRDGGPVFLRLPDASLGLSLNA